MSKVLFYLYNDVFKDFGLEEVFFKDENGETMIFTSYFDNLGKVEESRVELFLKNLGLNPILMEKEVSDDEMIEDDELDGGNKKPASPIDSIQIGNTLSINANGKSAIDFLVDFFKIVGLDRLSKFKDLKRGKFQVVVKSQENPEERYYKKSIEENGENYYIHTYNGNDEKRKFIKLIADKFYPDEPLTILPIIQ